MKPPRIKPCKAHAECKVLRTRIIGSTFLVLGTIEAISLDKEIEKLDVKEQAIALKRPIFLYIKTREYEKSDVRRNRKNTHTLTHTLTERSGEVEIISEAI